MGSTTEAVGGQAWFYRGSMDYWTVLYGLYLMAGISRCVVALILVLCRNWPQLAATDHTLECLP